MSIPDLYARNVRSHQEYREKSALKALNFDENQKIIIELMGKVEIKEIVKGEELKIKL